MVRIVVMDWDSFSRMVHADLERGIKTGSFSKQEDVIYAENLEAARRIMASERLKMLSTIRKEKPASLYELAKSMKKDIKTVATDANILRDMGLLKLEPYLEGGRKKVRPVTHVRTIQLEIAI